MAALRTATLDSWRASPTRLREDAATEADLRHGGYRDRVLTELAQNAADAATAAGILGELAVWLTTAESGAQRLHVSNTGAPLDTAGVESLCALRASSKTGGVGRFGVGFTSVSMISEEIDLRSSSGSVRFSGARTRDALAQSGISEPEVGAPVLRLAWAVDEPPADGADTEVVLTLNPDVDARGLMEQMAGEAVDLLLELTGLGAITVDGATWTRTRTELPDSLAQISIGEKSWLEASRDGVRWLVRMDGDRVLPAGPDVLRAPTRSDEELSLPALLVVDVPMAPDRRRLLPTSSIAHAAHSYPALVRAVSAEQRLALVPVPGFARSTADASIRASIIAALRDQDWLPTVQGRDVSAARAVVLPNLTPELAEVLAETIDSLIVPELSGPSGAVALAAADVTILDPGGLAQLLSGMAREPSWWRRLYDALEPLAADSLVAEQLSSLPVPLADGRIVTGPRTVVVGHDLDGVDGFDFLEGGLALPWVRLAHPQASHPLLTRLGAGEISVLELLRAPELEAAVADAAEDDWHGEPEQLADTVLALAALVPEGAELPSWLGGILLPDADGELSAADELLLAGAPLAQVLTDESPFGLVDEQFRARHSDAALRAIGVGWGFTLLRVDAPTGPDHDLDDEDLWWDDLDDEPETLIAVRDLDLVHPDRWREALTMLVADPQTRPLLADRDGYTAWWLRRHAELGGQPLGLLRGADETFAGLLDQVGSDEAQAYSGLLAGAKVESAELAETLLERLGDADRSPSASVVATTHRLLAEALVAGVILPEDLDAPARVRALDGTVVPADTAMVLDQAWLAAAVAPSALVLGALASAAELAELLDIDVASDQVRAEVVSTGRVSTYGREPRAVLAAAQRGVPVPTGEIRVHAELRVRLADGQEIAVPWWVDEAGRAHTDERWSGPLD